jgi:hypothetical protein
VTASRASAVLGLLYVAAGCPASRAGSGAGPSRSVPAERAEGPLPDVDDGVVFGEATLARWRRLTSQHFTLTTDHAAPEADRILMSLEEYFSALTTVCFAAASPGTERIPVLALATEADSRRFLAPKTSGLFVHRLGYLPFILLGTSGRAWDDHIVRHELVHYVMRLSHRRELPLWFGEGMAEYFQTLAYDRSRGYLLFGRPTMAQVQTVRQLGLLPAGALIAGDLDGEMMRERARYYATSWLIVHALMHGSPQVFSSYERGLLSGSSSTDAWLAAAPADLRTGIDGHLTRYLAEKRYESGRRVRWTAPPVVATTASLDRAEMEATRALLHVAGARQQPERRQAHVARAKARAATALELDPASLDAVLVMSELEEAPGADAARRAAHAREGSWVGWLALFDELEREPSAKNERREALAHAAKIAPDEEAVLAALGRQALADRQWLDAASWFARALAFAPDDARLLRGYLEAMVHHPACGKLVAAGPPPGENRTPADQQRAWERLAETAESCRANQRERPARPPGVRSR